LGFMVWWPVGLATLAFIIGSGRMSWKNGSVSRWHGAAEQMRSAVPRRNAALCLTTPSVQYAAGSSGQPRSSAGRRRRRDAFIVDSGNTLPARRTAAVAWRLLQQPANSGGCFIDQRLLIAKEHFVAHGSNKGNAAKNFFQGGSPKTGSRSSRSAQEEGCSSLPSRGVLPRQDLLTARNRF